jgi:hypothetical protein
MNKPNQSTDQTESKYTQSPIVNAFLIGFLIGIIIFSVAVNSWGFLTLIPLFLIYKLTQKPKSPESNSEAPSSED